MSQTKNFIITKDETTANQLINSGLRLISKTAGVWTFQNEASYKLNFENFDKTMIAYTNILSI